MITGRINQVTPCYFAGSSGIISREVAREHMQFTKATEWDKSHSVTQLLDADLLYGSILLLEDESSPL